MRYLLFFFCLLALPASAAPVPSPLALYFDNGKGVAIGALVDGGRVYLDAEAVARVLRLPYVESAGKAVLSSQPLSKCLQVSGVTYADAVEMAQVLHLKAQFSENGKVLEVWTAEGYGNRVQLSASLNGSQRVPSASLEEDSFSYTLQIRNNSNQANSLSGDDFFLVDSENNVYSCDEDFNAVIPAHGSQALSNLNFSFPKGKTARYLLVLVNGSEAARVRI